MSGPIQSYDRLAPRAVNQRPVEIKITTGYQNVAWRFCAPLRIPDDALAKKKSSRGLAKLKEGGEGSMYGK